MRKISIITLHAVKNYGSMLQTIATQELFKSIGYETEIIHYVRKDISFFQNLKQIGKNDTFIAKHFKRIIGFPSLLRFTIIWNKAYKKYLKLTRRYNCFNDFIKHPIKTDLYCSGSDQVWNSEWNGGLLKEFFLGFAPEHSPKIAFSSSFGMNSIPSDELEQIKALLSDYSAISVREEQSLKLLEDLGIHNAVNILDPTLIKTKDFWINYFNHKKRKIAKKYMLVYQLSSNREFDELAEKISKHLGLKLVRIALRYDQIRKNGHKVFIPTIPSFLNLFYFADYVFTDSFHGLSFCLNFQKQFSIMLPSRFSDRLTNILKKTNTMERIIKNGDLSGIYKTIDYSFVEKALGRERMIALDFLQKVRDNG